MDTQVFHGLDLFAIDWRVRSIFYRFSHPMKSRIDLSWMPKFLFRDQCGQLLCNTSVPV